MTTVALALLAAAALGPSDTGAALRTGDGRVQEGGTLLIGSPFFDFIDPALALPFQRRGVADGNHGVVERCGRDVRAALPLPLHASSRRPVRPRAGGRGCLSARLARRQDVHVHDSEGLSLHLFRNNPSLRRAVNFAIDRPALLAAAGPYFGSVTDDYLPTGLPGYVDAHLYPLRHPDLRKAQALARGHTGSGKAVLYTCDNVLFGCLVQSQLIQAELKQIGIDVEIKQFANAVYAAKEGTRGEPFDLVIDRHDPAWVDPSEFVDVQLDGRRTQATGNVTYSSFNSAHYNRLIDQAGRLSGSARYDAYGKLAVDIARDAAPLAAINVRNNRFFVSSRVGCVRVGARDLDLAGLCLR